MILRSEMLPLLVDACPSFAEKWELHKRENFDEDNFLPYVALMEFDAHIVQLFRAGRTQEFNAIFQVIERLHTDGEHYVREAATIGILEGMQNFLGDDKKALESFRAYLLPESQKWWEQVNLFWDGEIKYVGETISR